VPLLYLQRRDPTGLEDLTELSVELRDVLRWLDEAAAGRVRVPAGYEAPVDVIETAAGLEVVADLPGVAADALRVIYTQHAVVIAGCKGAPACSHRGATFHLAERTYGRFARVVRLGPAVDAARARATLRDGELRIVLPRVDDRRGHDVTIPVETK
jgi:HSP20 family protein